MTMKSEIFIELLKIMLRKFIKTKIIVCQNVNFMLNLFNSYDGSRRRRDRSKRSHHRQSPEPDTKQQRRYRKPPNHHNAEKNGEVVRTKVSSELLQLISKKHIFMREKRKFEKVLQVCDKVAVKTNMDI